MIEKYTFRPLKDHLENIFIDKIIEFKINDEIIKINNFKSIFNAYNYIIKNKNNLNYIKWYNQDQHKIEYYIKNQKLHNLNGPSIIIKIYEKNTFIKKKLIDKKVFYYINGNKLKYSEFKKHPSIRKEKLKRILKIKKK